MLFPPRGKGVDWLDKDILPVGVIDTCVLVTQLCQTPCDTIDYSPPGSPVHRILQERILEWVAIPFSRRSS